MIIIRMKGGLGNQMFEYALYRALEENGKQVKMDDVYGFAVDTMRDELLTRVFGLSYARAEKQETLDMIDRDKSPLNWLRRRFAGSRAKEYQEPDDGNFDPRVFDLDDVYLKGYWQSERYFADEKIKSQLREDFHLDPDTLLKDNAAWERLGRIRQTDSVSVHIRRGDYLLPEISANYGEICTERYYHAAVEYMLDKYPRATFFIFSNDQEWTEKHFKGDRFVIMDFNDDQTDATDLFLMSRCRHNIIANSSYSWWAAWLNDNPEKTVVAPAKWLNTKNMTDIYTDWMVRL